MNLTKAELIIVMQDVINTLGTNILYKYRADNEHTENIIKNSALWFSRPREFNDPFDCYSVPAKFSKQEAQMWLHNRISYKEASENDKKIAERNINNLSLLDVKSDIDEVVNNIGICCFNKTEKEILMWSHYSDGHKGLCLQFDIKEDPMFFLLPKKVKYETSITPLNYFKEGSEKLLIDRFIVPKYNKWSYEQEVRIIKISDEMKFNESDKGKEIKFKTSSLRKIIFGCKASDETISKYKDLCAKNGFNHVTFSKMQQKMDGTYELEETSLY